MAFYVPTDCVRFARYRGEIYSRYLYPFGGFESGIVSIISFYRWRGGFRSVYCK